MSLPQPISKNWTALKTEISSGQIKIPRFQRDLVWSMSKSAALLDSVVKGYPVGTFITWHTMERLRSHKNIGDLVLPDPDKNEYMDYVLDGQQRITSLYAALEGLTVKRKDGEEDFKEIVVDLDAEENESIVTLASEMDKGHTTIPLHVLYEGNLIVLTKFDKKYHPNIQKYKHNIDSYQYSTIQVPNTPIDVATDIFERTNVGGVTLSVVEIMAAKTYDDKKKFDLAEKLEKLMADLREVGYDGLAGRSILDLISLVLKKECKKKTILSLDKNKVIDVWDDVVKAVKDVIEHLQTVYRIPVYNLLPYDKLVVPLAYFFYKNKGNPNLKQQKYLTDFFWRVSLYERYTSATDSKLAQDVKRIDAILDDRLPEYDWSINSSPEFIKRHGQFRPTAAYTKAILCIYAYYRPESFENGALVKLKNDGVQRANSKSFHHFFPQKYLRKLGIHDQDINNVLNITIIDESLNKRKIRDRSPSAYMSDFKKGNDKLAQTMKTHLIEDLDEFGVWTNDYQKFLDMRAKILSKFIEERIILQKGDKQHSSNLANNDFKEDIDLEIPDDEDTNNEFKETFSVPTQGGMAGEVKMEVAIAVAAFANTDGGRVFIGVKDDGKPVGLKKDLKQHKHSRDKLVQAIGNYLRTKLSRTLNITTHFRENYMVVVVPKRRKNNWVYIDGKFYVRTLNSSPELTPEETAKYQRDNAV